MESGIPVRVSHAKKPLKQVNAQFFAEDIEAIKLLAEKDGLPSWHPTLRQMVHLGLQVAKRRRIIK